MFDTESIISTYFNSGPFRCERWLASVGMHYVVRQHLNRWHSLHESASPLIRLGWFTLATAGPHRIINWLTIKHPGLSEEPTLKRHRRHLVSDTELRCIASFGLSTASLSHRHGYNCSHGHRAERQQAVSTVLGTLALPTTACPQCHSLASACPRCLSCPCLCSPQRRRGLFPVWTNTQTHSKQSQIKI